jgi:hypothetical protein
MGALPSFGQHQAKHNRDLESREAVAGVTEDQIEFCAIQTDEISRRALARGSKPDANAFRLIWSCGHHA